MGRIGLLLLSGLLLAGTPAKKSPTKKAAQKTTQPVVSAFCTEKAASQKAIDPTGRCVCECSGGAEGGAPCAFVTIQSRYHGGDSWCPNEGP